MTLRKILAYLLAIAIAIILCAYIYNQSKTYLKGPQLNITSPTSGTSTDQTFIPIEGFAGNVSFITMNDNQIFIDESGVFKEKLLLAPGYNIIEVKAKDRFGRIISRKVYITRTSKDEVPAVLPVQSIEQTKTATTTED